MKFKKNFKKGFTLVELIVVIAIVAILAAVSVVSYLAFINQANESADIQLVKQLNVALQADEALNDTRDTMKEMLVGMEAQGFVVENLTKTKSGYDIVWDQEHNRFALLNNEDKVIYSESSFNMNKDNLYTFWKFADTEQEASNKKYSVYLTDQFKDVEILTVGAGLDAGNYVGLTEVTYDNSANDAVAQTNVILNTNGGKLTINGPKDTIAHRGYAKSVDIVAVDELHSYHEYGEVGFTQIEKGHYVGEEGAKVTVLLATGSASDVTIDNNGADIEKAYTTDESAKETNHGGNESLDYYEVTPAEGQTQEEAIAEAIETLETGATLFAGGNGTESDPYLINTIEHLSNIGNDDQNVLTYYKLQSDLYVSASTWYCAYLYNGDFDLNNHLIDVSIDETNKYNATEIFIVGKYANVHNGKINMNGEMSLFYERDPELNSVMSVKNVDFTGSMNVNGFMGPHFGIISAYSGNFQNRNDIITTVIIENINSWVSIKANSTCIGGLLGYCLNTKISIKNVNVYSYIETGYGAGGIVMSDSQVTGNYIAAENIVFDGNILVPQGKKAYYYGSKRPNQNDDSVYAGQNAVLVTGINIDNDILVAENGEFKINADSAYTRYVVRYAFSVDYLDDHAGGYPRVIEKEFSNTDNQIISTGLYKNKVVEDSYNPNTDTYVTDGTNGIFTRNGVDNTYFYDGNGTFKLSKYDVTVTVYAYSGDSLKAVGSYSYPKN